MKSAEIREAFLKFFERQGHKIVPSSSLVPANDPTLLFTNAGMVQFKDVFLGQDKRSYKRATSSQRCVRAGGKHNDLENVGYTARHHTFFEMLGNFSFGDYFKEDAIQFAWDFLTHELAIPQEKLWVTVHISDDEAADIWLKKIGVSADRFSRLDEDNFWQMGDTGPCGPSSEIFYDHGEDVPGGPPGSENDELDRYIEIWNLVFMQYERQGDGSLSPLPKPSVDTGMGLERMAAVLQGVHSNYEIDIFKNLLAAVANVTACNDKEDKSLRVIADHIRSCAFLVSDGVLPSNEKQGYVLRRIIRRAVRHGNKLGKKEPFFYKLVGALAEEMGAAYPELREKQALIEKILLAEEEQFARTLDKGLKILESELQSMKGKVIPGEIVFLLHGTYGFPIDLTNDIARERGLSLDVEGYEALMKEEKTKAGDADIFVQDYTTLIRLDASHDFSGYKKNSDQGDIIALFDEEGKAVESLSADQKGVVILSNTPFYAESGGQVGDTGYLSHSNGKFEVVDCQKSGNVHLHVGKVLSGEVRKGQNLNAEIDAGLRQATKLNHSATHLLHAALRDVLGDHVTQKGSLVDSQRLRFDFSHFDALTDAELRQVQAMVNSKILENSAVFTEVCDMETAKQKGAMALFGEKYGEEVRVLSMGDGFSVELCGGTHVERTGDIGLMHITMEAGIAAGVRRIEAVTGKRALQLLSEFDSTLSHLAAQLKCSREALPNKVQSVIAQAKNLEKEVTRYKGQLASASASDWAMEAVEIEGIKVLAKIMEDGDAKSLRDTVDKLKNKLGTAVIILGLVNGDKVVLSAGVTKDATSKVKAGDLLKHVASQIDGKGGGRPDMAQGGGNNPLALPAAMESVISWVKKSISV